MTGVLDPHPSAVPRFPEFSRKRFMTRAQWSNLISKMPSPYIRHRSRRSLRQAQRHYRQTERLSNENLVVLTKDLPAYGGPGPAVPDCDVSSFISVAEAGPRSQRRISISAPARMYRRLMQMRHHQIRNLIVHRRFSLSWQARIEKAPSKVDEHSIEIAEQQRESLRASLQIAQRTLCHATLE